MILLGKTNRSPEDLAADLLVFINREIASSWAAKQYPHMGRGQQNVISLSIRIWLQEQGVAVDSVKASREVGSSE